MGATLLLNINQLLLTSTGASYYVKALLTLSDESSEVIGNVFIPLEEASEEDGHYSVKMSQESYSVSFSHDGKYETIPYCLDDTLSSIIKYMQKTTYILDVNESAFREDKFNKDSHAVECDLPSSLLSTHKSRSCFLNIKQNRVVLRDGKGKAWIRLGYKPKDEKETQLIHFSAQNAKSEWHRESMPIEQFLEEVKQSQRQESQTMIHQAADNFQRLFDQENDPILVLDNPLDWSKWSENIKESGKYLIVIYPGNEKPWNLELLSGKKENITSLRIPGSMIGSLHDTSLAWREGLTFCFQTKERAIEIACMFIENSKKDIRKVSEFTQSESDMTVLRELPRKVGSVYVIPEGIERIETKYGDDNFDGCSYIRKFEFPHSFAKVKLDYYTYSREVIVSEKTECVWNGWRDKLNDSFLGVFRDFSFDDLFLTVKNAENKKIAKLLIPGAVYSDEAKKDSQCMIDRLNGFSLTSAEGIARYDECFDELKSIKMKLNIAINRLVYPQSLSPEYYDKYRQYILENVDHGSWSGSHNSIQTFKSLCKLGLITKEEKDNVVAQLSLNKSDRKQIDNYFK